MYYVYFFRSRREADRKREECKGKQGGRQRTVPNKHHHTANDRRKALAVVEAKEVTMLARATKALQEHMKDMTEKTKTCCVPAKLAEKENLHNLQNVLRNPDPQPYGQITDHTTGTTYLKGKLLGKVRKVFHLIPYYISVALWVTWRVQFIGV